MGPALKRSLQAATKKATGMAFPKPSGIHISPLCSPDPRHGARRVNIYPIGFDLILIQFFSVFLFLLFGITMFTLPFYIGIAFITCFLCLQKFTDKSLS